MKIIKADKSHKEQVLHLLDEFRTACMIIIDPASTTVSTTAQEHGGDLFDKVIASPNSAIFLADENGEYVGIVTVHKIPQIRKGVFCGEIEEMYVRPKHQGTGTSQIFIEAAVEWAKGEGITTIRLESHNGLKRAHAFYEKAGFSLYGRAYEMKI